MHWWESWGHVCGASKIGPLSLSPNKVSEDIARTSGDCKGLRWTVTLTIQDRPRLNWYLLPSAPIIKALNEPPRDRKKQKDLNHSGNITFQEIVNTAPQKWHASVARELSGTVQEILGTAQSVGRNVDGCHLRDLIDGINSGAAECPTS